MNIEWGIVKGVFQFANDLDPPNNLWKPFACTMAASLVFNMLNDPLIFKNWPHFDGKCSSAWVDGVTLYKPSISTMVRIVGYVCTKRGSTLLPFILVTGCVGVVQCTQAILSEGFSVST